MKTKTEKNWWNSNLHKAKKEKNDEFYTQIADIENELKHYKEHFKDKVVFCNCDDPYESNFFKYFAWNFKHLGLKKLIAMWYSTSPIVNTQLRLFDIEWIEDTKSKAYKTEMTDLVDINEDWALNLIDVEILAKKNKNNIKITLLKWDWDFRSEESLNCLKECDIVVTNPPFSLFREYIAQLMEYEKKFLIIWNNNAITYRDIFKYIKENKLWLWYAGNKTMIFQLSPDYEKFDYIENAVKYWKVPAISWYTNLEHSKRNEEMILFKNYSQEEYIKYFNFDWINTDKVTDIPCDYDWIIWVPITFLNNYNPKQFEIIWLWISNSWIEVWVKPYTPEHKKYRKEVQKRWAVDWDLYILENWLVKVPYARILIKRKK